MLGRGAPGLERRRYRSRERERERRRRSRSRSRERLRRRRSRSLSGSRSRLRDLQRMNTMAVWQATREQRRGSSQAARSAAADQEQDVSGCLDSGSHPVHLIPGQKPSSRPPQTPSCRHAPAPHRLRRSRLLLRSLRLDLRSRLRLLLRRRDLPSRLSLLPSWCFSAPRSSFPRRSSGSLTRSGGDPPSLIAAGNRLFAGACLTLSAEAAGPSGRCAQAVKEDCFAGNGMEASGKAARQTMRSMLPTCLLCFIKLPLLVWSAGGPIC